MKLYILELLSEKHLVLSASLLLIILWFSYVTSSTVTSILGSNFDVLPFYHPKGGSSLGISLACPTVSSDVKN